MGTKPDQLRGRLIAKEKRGNATNVETAIALLNEALKVRTREAVPQEWAETIFALANAYRDRAEGDPVENIEHCITLHLETLSVRRRETLPLEWASTQLNLGNAYAERRVGDRAENLSKAEAAYRAALEEFSLEREPTEHRLVQSNLAELYFRDARWKEAADTYRRALDATERLYETSTTLQARLRVLAMVKGVPARLAYSLSKLGDVREALEVIERGRGRTLVYCL
jgi:tetratricopeptide (TPR) repeat protein